MSPAAPGKRRTKVGQTEATELAKVIRRRKLARYLGKCLEAYKKKGGNISELARTLDVERNYIYRWTSTDGWDAKNEPSGTMLFQLLKALGVEIKPMPPELSPLPLNVELRSLREELVKLAGEVAAQSTALATLTEIVTAEHEAPEASRSVRRTQP